MLYPHLLPVIPASLHQLTQDLIRAHFLTSTFQNYTSQTFWKKNNTRTCGKGYSTFLLGSLNRRQLRLPPGAAAPRTAAAPGPAPTPGPRPWARLCSPCSRARLFSSQPSFPPVEESRVESLRYLPAVTSYGGIWAELGSSAVLGWAGDVFATCTAHRSVPVGSHNQEEVMGLTVQ